MRLALLIGMFWVALTATATPTNGQGTTNLVRVTPLGSHAGELCFFDRAMIFEDPAGIRILYDPGRTVDENDPRLGDIHVMLLSHAHLDHLGDVRPARGTGTCGAPAFGAANAHSNFATIAAAKRPAIVVNTEAAGFLASRIRNVTGAAVPPCPTSGPENETIVPAPTACTAGINPGAGSRMLTRSGVGSVRITTVPAQHGNAIPPQFLDAAMPTGVVATAGHAVGYIITFSNGLRAYLTGDTGPTSEMEMIARLYRPQLAVVNTSDIFTMSPREAAFSVLEYLRPQSVIISHVNEQGTNGGVESSGTRTERFGRMIRGVADVVVGVSDVTRSFDRDGRCLDCR